MALRMLRAAYPHGDRHRVCLCSPSSGRSNYREALSFFAVSLAAFARRALLLQSLA